MNTTYVVFNDGLLVAVYNHRNDLRASMKLVLEQHDNRISELRKYSIFMLTEHIEDSNVFLGPKKVVLESLIQEDA